MPECLQLQLQLQLYLLFDKRKIQNGRFPQMALASRGGKRQEKIGLHYSLSNLNKVLKSITSGKVIEE